MRHRRAHHLRNGFDRGSLYLAPYRVCDLDMGDGMTRPDLEMLDDPTPYIDQDAIGSTLFAANCVSAAKYIAWQDASLASAYATIDRLRAEWPKS